MDTRNKIIGLEQASALVLESSINQDHLKIVTGYFDVLLAEHVRRLREIADGASRLLVVVLDPPDPVLAARARAELVAALDMVDYVVPADEHAAYALLGRFAGGEVVREESDDLLRAHRLRQHVQSRHQP